MRKMFVTLLFVLLIFLSAEVFSDEQAPPDPPSNLQAIAQGSEEIEVNWEDNAENEDGFKLYRARSGGFNLIADLGPNTTYYRDTGLKPNNRYYYKVTAYNEAGESGYSNEDYTTTYQTRPKAPSGLSAKAVSSRRIELNWFDNADNEDGFKVYRDEGSGYLEIANLGRNTNFYTDSNLKPKIKYYYRVTSYNDAGDSDYSNDDWAVTK